jgi:hypothetical protein
VVQPKKYIIDTFKGVNKRATETLLQLGEASDMGNFMITDDMKAQKMYGYAHLFPSMGAHKINGMWYGALSGTSHMLFACDGHVYKHDLTTGTNTDLGTLADAFPTKLWVTNNTVYIMNGIEIYSWSGSGSITAVPGYIPTVLTAALPSGGGTLLESINYLTGKKRIRYSPDGIATVYQLPEYSISSVDSVILAGVTLTLGVDYTVNPTNGTIIFVSAPPSGTNSLDVVWDKPVAGDRQLIANCRYYGGSFASRHWLYGNQNHKNTRYVSGITIAGASDPAYWPKFNDSDVGEYEITDIVSQYNRQVIFTTGNESEAAAWYSYMTTYTDPSTNLIVTQFPVEPINKKIGNVAKGQTQIIYNNPFTIWKGVYEWASTNVVDEKNARWVSENIQNDLDKVDLTAAVTVDWSDKGQYWLCVGNKAWVLNYRVGAWYILELAHTPTCFAIVDSQLYFGTEDGMVMKFDETLGTYDGTNIHAFLDTGYHTLGGELYDKFIPYIHIAMLPFTTTHIDIYISTDRAAPFRAIQPVSYGLSSFDDWDFSNLSFEVNYSPQPFKRDVGANAVGYVKLRFVNDGTDSVLLLSAAISVFTGGEVNRR